VLGDSDAQNNLGVMYFNGQFVKQNFRKAFECYKKAADMGNPTAQYNVGNMYEQGKGISINGPKAREWYMKAYRNPNSSDEIRKLAKDGYGRMGGR
ncbi:MAG: sel1 repeat family protein, partial [Synergistaceae bacterium]|nr:sel1 repeat family protein [Synergistaceae bacterium]